MRTLDDSTQRTLDEWLNGAYDEATKQEIRRLQREDPQELANAFYQKLAFGTGGLRGILGVGSNRMNIYTVRAATQGFANYLKSMHGNKKISVIIGFDSRHHSEEFARQVAKVFAGNQIEVFLFRQLRPLPLISFGILNKKCAAGVMITASHNPPEYNGYKAFWSNGAQVLPPHDQGIIDEIDRILRPEMVQIGDDDSPFIHMIDEEIDHAYLKAIHSLQHYPLDNKKSGHLLKIIYTSLHGAGITFVPKALADWGFTRCILVEEQQEPDGRFPTVETPNPEEPSALKIGIEKLRQENGDILIGTDPDTDRIGVALIHQGKPVLLNGNQIACLCLEHICRALTTLKMMPEKAICVKTIVTSELFKAICNHYRVLCLDVLTGFKYIGEKIDQWSREPRAHQFIFGGEESYGYLLGTHARDKDAVISANLIAEAALHLKLQGKTLIDFLNELYQKYGAYREKLLSLTLKGIEGSEKIQKIMASFRDHPPIQFCGMNVTRFEDYQRGVAWDLKNETKADIDLPKSNVLRFWLQDQTKIVIRPSGTEPKIKFYCEVTRTVTSSLDETLEACDALIDEYLKTLS